MNQVNHGDIQHEWFMIYIVYAMNVQSHERMKETLLDAKHRRYRLNRSRVFGVFVLFNYEERGLQMTQLFFCKIANPRQLQPFPLQAGNDHNKPDHYTKQG